MRIESSVTAISWIPSEAITARRRSRCPFEIGHRPLRRAAARPHRRPRRVARRRQVPLRQRAASLDQRDRRRRDPQLRLLGRLVIGSTTLHLGKQERRRSPRPRSPTSSTTRWSRRPSVTFVQTGGGRTGAPAPRRVSKPPFVQFQAPTAWSTLSLTIHNDGTRRARAHRGQPVPAPLGLRRRRRPHGQDRPHRLQGLVPPRVRQPLAVGRRGLARVRDRRSRPRSSASCRRQLDEGRRQAEIQEAEGGPDARRRRATEANEMFLLLDGVIEVDRRRRTVVAELGPGAMHRRARADRRRQAHGHADGVDQGPRRGGRRVERGARRCSPNSLRVTSGRTTSRVSVADQPDAHRHRLRAQRPGSRDGARARRLVGHRARTQRGRRRRDRHRRADASRATPTIRSPRSTACCTPRRCSASSASDNRVEWATFDVAGRGGDRAATCAAVCSRRMSTTTADHLGGFAAADGDAWRDLTAWWDKVGRHFFSMMLSPLGALASRAARRARGQGAAAASSWRR